MAMSFKLLRQIPFPVVWVLITTFVTNAGIFMILPFLSVYLGHTLHVSLPVIGLTVGVTLAISNGGALVAGHYVDRIGAYPMLLSGLLLRVLSFFGLWATQNTWLIFFVVQLTSVGHAIYLPAARKVILDVMTRQQHPFAVALSRGAENAGMGLGPLIGAMVFFANPQGVFLWIGVLFLLTFCLSLLFVPRHSLVFKEASPSSVLRFSMVLRRRSVLWVTLLLVFHTFLYIPFFSFMPLYIKPVFGAWGISFLLAFNALSVFIFQPFFARRITAMPFALSIFLGFSLIGVGIGLYHWLWWGSIFLGTVIITVGEIIGTLRMEYTLTRLGTSFSGTMFGLMRLAFGLGGALGSVAAGLMQSTLNGFGIDQWMFWPIQGGIGIFMGVFLGFFSLIKPLKGQTSS